MFWSILVFLSGLSSLALLYQWAMCADVPCDGFRTVLWCLLLRSGWEAERRGHNRKNGAGMYASKSKRKIRVIFFPSSSSLYMSAFFESCQNKLQWEFNSSRHSLLLFFCERRFICGVRTGFWIQCAACMKIWLKSNIMGEEKLFQLQKTLCLNVWNEHYDRLLYKTEWSSRILFLIWTFLHADKSTLIDEERNWWNADE